MPGSRSHPSQSCPAALTMLGLEGLDAWVPLTSLPPSHAALTMLGLEGLDAWVPSTAPLEASLRQPQH